MKLCIVGTGYVGLVSATVFAELGNTVIGVDINERKIADLQNNIMPIFEPGLQELVERNQKEGRLRFTTDIKDGIENSEVIFSAVGTPPDQDHRADLQYVRQVAEDFGRYLNGYKILVNKSTVPVGTGALCREIIAKGSKGKHEFDVVSNPEFLREGAAVKDTLQPDRIIVGVESDRARKVMEELFTLFHRTGRVPILYTTLKNAEIIKYASNSFLATKISYINELANFCDHLGEGVNIKDIAEGMGLDTRIGSRFLSAGIGYGGSCFPKDIRALMEKGKEVGYHFRIIAEVDAVNEDQKKLPVRKLRQMMPDLKGKTIAIWGLAFKPNTDDMRDAPSIEVIYELTKLGAKVQAYDPVAGEIARGVFSSLTNVTIMDEPYKAVEGADALLLLTEWNEFRNPDFDRMKKVMKGNVIVDGRNIWDATKLKLHDIEINSIGH